MAETATVEEKPLDIPAMRRLQTADLTEHGAWILERLLKQHPNHNQRSIIGWLHGLTDSNEHLFLYQPHAVCLAERVFTYTLDAKPLVFERFVFCEDKDNALHQMEASWFYPEMLRWAKQAGIDKVFVMEKSDVPDDMVRKRVGRVHEVKQFFARV